MPQQNKKTKERWKGYQRKRRESETPTQRKCRKEKDAKRHRNKRNNETPEEHNVRVMNNRKRRQNETDLQRDNRLKKQRAYRAKKKRSTQRNEQSAESDSMNKSHHVIVQTEEKLSEESVNLKTQQIQNETQVHNVDALCAVPAQTNVDLSAVVRSTAHRRKITQNKEPQTMTLTPDMNVDSLEDESNDDMEICQICCQRKLDAYFLPCGHRSCFACARKELEDNCSRCCFCRKEVSEVLEWLTGNRIKIKPKRRKHVEDFEVTEQSFYMEVDELDEQQDEVCKVCGMDRNGEPWTQCDFCPAKMHEACAKPYSAARSCGCD